MFEMNTTFSHFKHRNCQVVFKYWYSEVIRWKAICRVQMTFLFGDLYVPKIPDSPLNFFPMIFLLIHFCWLVIHWPEPNFEMEKLLVSYNLSYLVYYEPSHGDVTCFASTMPDKKKYTSSASCGYFTCLSSTRRL